jgi:hypothetical protein
MITKIDEFKKQVPKQYFKTIEQLRISYCSGISSWQMKGYLNQEDYEKAKLNGITSFEGSVNYTSVNSS